MPTHLFRNIGCVAPTNPCSSVGSQRGRIGALKRGVFLLLVELFSFFVQNPKMPGGEKEGDEASDKTPLAHSSAADHSAPYQSLDDDSKRDSRAI